MPSVSGGPTGPGGWIRFRVARPVHDLARSMTFYRDVIGLRPQGSFHDHDGYDGAFFALPGGGELELTAGPVEPVAGTEEDLLVLYVNTIAEVRAIGSLLAAADARTVDAANPYWQRFGQTFLDPDGYRIVVATLADDGASENAAGRDDQRNIEIDWYVGPRERIRPLFEEAEDSRSQLDDYLEQGRVLVARDGSSLLGHLQLLPTSHPGEIELKNMAVHPDHRGTGVGRALVTTAVARCTADGWSRMLVATAAADIGNLRFYQRLGFRFSSVDRNAFTAATGYPEPIVIDGIPLLDRVWLSQDVYVDRPGFPASAR